VSGFSSLAAQKTKEKIDESTSYLGGINETSIKVLHFFLKEIAGFENYKIDILYDAMPKQVIIHIFTDAGVEYYLKPKEDGVFNALSDKMGVPDYLIRFATRGEKYGS